MKNIHVIRWELQLVRANIRLGKQTHIHTLQLRHREAPFYIETKFRKCTKTSRNKNSTKIFFSEYVFSVFFCGRNKVTKFIAFFFFFFFLVGEQAGDQVGTSWFEETTKTIVVLQLKLAIQPFKFKMLLMKTRTKFTLIL